MIQGLSRFLLDQFVKQFQQTAQTDDMERVFQTTATNTIKCTSCRSESTRPSPTNVNDLIYTVQSQGRNQKTPVTFSQILKSSVERETVSKGWCSRCSRYQNISNRKTIHSIPSVFVLNVAIGSAENKRLWATPGWLPEEIGIIIKDGKFFCYEKDGLEHHLERGMYDIAVYSLVGVVVDVDLMAEQQRRSHLVAMVNGQYRAAHKWRIIS